MNDLLILGIDTSGKTASVSLYEDGIVIGENSIYTSRTHSQVILPLCKRLLSDCGKELSDVDRIAVADGPGSYTGLRIGISAVKAITFALDKECCGVSTLEGLAYNLSCVSGYICPVMKARQDLVYTGLFFSGSGSIQRKAEDNIISMSELDGILSGLDNPVYINGDGAEAFLSEYPGENRFIAPPHLRLQNASGLCLACLQHRAQTPDELEARYLQLVKAEKDLINS